MWKGEGSKERGCWAGGASVYQSDRRKRCKEKNYTPMSLIFSPGSKGGSSISANLLDSLRTWMGASKKRNISF
jgi:hypothetical protein